MKNKQKKEKTGKSPRIHRTEKQKEKEMVPSRIELLILALLAPRLNQLGQGTESMSVNKVVCTQYIVTIRFV